jgi:tetratricopeptide (TPR) repeat protein
MKRALEEYSKSIAISPNVDALFERGEMYESAGEHQKAIDDFTLAIEGMRDAPYMYRARALAKRNLGDIAGYEADRDFAHTIEHPH